MDRRKFLKTGGGSILLYSTGQAAVIADANAGQQDHYPPVNIIINDNYTSPAAYSSTAYQTSLKKAVLEFLEKTFENRTVMFWNKRFDQVNFEKRIKNIIFWVVRAVEKYQKDYPLDPAWIMAQIMKESYFNEFAISPSFAAGICQFMPSTAKAYNMQCAGTITKHLYSPYKSVKFAARMHDAKEEIKNRSEFKKKNSPKIDKEMGRLFAKLSHDKHIVDGFIKKIKNLIEYINSSVQKDLQILEVFLEMVGSKDRGYYYAAKEYMAFLDELNKYDTQIKQYKADFREYLHENLKGRSIFNDDDVKFLIGFDERFTYKKPIDAMVKEMTSRLRSRNGDILTAGISYNAGPKATYDEKNRFGRIPMIRESLDYIHDILIYHFEITRRMV